MRLLFIAVVMLCGCAHNKATERMWSCVDRIPDSGISESERRMLVHGCYSLCAALGGCPK